MITVNKVTILGNLGKDPDVVTFDSNNIKATFPVATSDSYKNKAGQIIEHTEWHTVVVWRRLAEISRDYLRKGISVYVEGKLQTRSWEDKEGNKRYATEIVADNLIILTKKEHRPDVAPSINQPSAIEGVIPAATTNEWNTETTSTDDFPF